MDIARRINIDGFDFSLDMMGDLWYNMFNE